MQPKIILESIPREDAINHSQLTAGQGSAQSGLLGDINHTNMRTAVILGAATLLLLISEGDGGHIPDIHLHFYMGKKNSYSGNNRAETEDGGGQPSVGAARVMPDANTNGGVRNANARPRVGAGKVSPEKRMTNAPKQEQRANNHMGAPNDQYQDDPAVDEPACMAINCQNPPNPFLARICCLK